MAPETRTPVSVDEFWHMAHRLPKAELIGGQVIELVPPGVRHGVLVLSLGQRLREHVAARGLGIVVSDAGFILIKEPPTVRAPDLAVVLKRRVPSPLPAKFFPGPPDLAVEVLSPDDRPSEVAAKVADYLRAGAHGVWVVDPDARTVTVHAHADVMRFARDEVMQGAPPLPDLALPLQTVFAEID
ncbi:MAG: Uma2 family endonuclease [bacterium]|nr:Uma2 family endonuclease [bacterium]